MQMKDISIFFQPIDRDNRTYAKDSLGERIDHHTEGNFPSIEQPGVALIYVPEHRNSSYSNLESPDSFRDNLYNLFLGDNWNSPIYDLGTISPGQIIGDTYHAISQVSKELIKNKCIPLIIGGSQDLTFALYKAYEQLEQLINLTTVDARLDLGDIDIEISNQGWLSQIILHKPCYLFNYSNLGAQSHYISNNELALFEKLYFDISRLGLLNENITLAEPVLRNTDILSFDLTAIRHSDFSGKHYSSPNGFFGNEACRMARYAGISDKISSIGFFNYFTEDINPASNELLAQLIWYFIDGYQNRKGDFPIGSKKSYTKYRVFLEELNEEITFLKSDKSGRWWMEVPYPSAKGIKYERHHLVPCSYEEYSEAMKGEIPNLWWKTFQKLG